VGAGLRAGPAGHYNPGIVPIDSLEPRSTLDEPWRRRPDWASGRVLDESVSAPGDAGLVVGWIFVLFWFGFLFLVALFVHAATQRRGQPEAGSAYLILGAFALAGLLPLVFVFKQTRHRARYGGSVFAMSAVPGVIGGRLDGTIEIPARLDRGTRVHATLSCWMRSTNARFPDELMWEVPAIDVGVYGASPTRVPLSFEIPFACSASHPDGVRGGAYWRLRAEGLDGASGLDANFVVPVFVTSQSRKPEPESPNLSSDPGARLGPPAATETDSERPSPSVLELRYRLGPVATLFCVFLPLVLPFVLVLTWPGRGEHGSQTWTITLFATPLVVAFALLTHFTEVMGVEVSDGKIILRRGYRGWFGARRIALADVRRIDLDTTYNNHKRVVARTRQGDEVGVSRWTTVMDAHGIADEVRRAITAAGGALDE
jgi:hypothetical protein